MTAAAGDDSRLGRRQFLALAGGVVGVAAAGLPACGGSRIAKAATSAYRSRPDLHPPLVSVTGRAGGVPPGHILVNLKGPLIFDTRGQIVWYKPITDRATANLRMQEFRDEPVLTWWEGQVMSPGYGSGDYVVADAAYREVARVRAGHGLHGDLHEFVLTPRGTALLTAYTATPDGLLDCAVQEVDVASGAVLLDWRARDHVDPSESHAARTKGQPFDFFHANSIDEDTDGGLLVSARNTWAVYKLDRRTGAVQWRLGGKKSDYRLGRGVAFAWQHDARRQPDGSISLFDDEAAPKVRGRSRGLVLRVDDRARTVSLEREYTHPHLLAGSQGSMQRLANGNVLIGWGALPNVTEYLADGTLIFDAQYAGATQSYRAFGADWHARPAEAPALVTARSGGAVDAYASWNGATDVARWELLGGGDAQSLHPVASSRRRGFETRVHAARRPAVVTARALDRAGRELGRSAVVAT